MEEFKSILRLSLQKHKDAENDMALIEAWITDIMAIGYNDCNLNLAAEDLYEMQVPLMDAGFILNQTIELYRTRIMESFRRFPLECTAFAEYHKQSKNDPEEALKSLSKKLNILQ